jgi:hypothetical protein
MNTDAITDKILKFVEQSTGATELDYEAYDGFQGPDIWEVVEDWYS